MLQLERRVRRAEAAQKNRASGLSRLTDEELEQRIDAILGRLGATRESVITQHGSLKAYADVIRQKLREEKHGTP